MNVLRSNCTPHPIKSAPLHIHDCWEIILNLTGHNISHIDGRDYDIAAQDVMVIPPFVEHGGFTEGDETYTDIYIAAERLDFDSVEVVHDYDGSLEPLFFMIMKLTAEKEANYEAIADSLLEAVVQYIKKYLGVRYRYPFVAEFKNLLFRKISDCEFDVTENIRALGYNPDYFRRCFISDTGTTPLGYLTALRIGEAKKLLAQNYMTVAEVAARCGYADSGYFSKKFRAAVGMSPVKYMKTALNLTTEREKNGEL